MLSLRGDRVFVSITLVRSARPREGEGLPCDPTSITVSSAQEEHDHRRAR